jgi:hypothetical protein
MTKFAERSALSYFIQEIVARLGSFAYVIHYPQDSRIRMVMWVRVGKTGIVKATSVILGAS